MHPVDHAEPDENVRQMLDQEAYRIPSSVVRVSQVAARAEHRHKGKQRQQGDKCPNDFVSFKVV